jgi:phosphoglycolate phosphatase
MAYRLVIFDFDGTLADSGPWFRARFNGVARRFGFKTLADDEFERLRGETNRAILDHLGVPMWKLPLIARHMRRLAAEEAESIPLFPGAAACLRRLDEAGIALAIVSSNREDTIRRILGPESAARIRHYACGAALFGKAAKIRGVLKRARVAGDQALSVGDEVRDIEAAAEARVATGAVTWGYATPAILIAHGPTHLFRSFDEIANAVIGSDPSPGEEGGPEGVGWGGRRQR